MKTNNYYKTTLLIFFISILVGCSSDSGGTSFIPGFNATWAVQGNADRQIDLQPNEANKKVPHGVFNGDEILIENDTTIKNPLSGSFNGLDIEFTIERPNHHSVQYSGKMTPVSEIDHTIIRIDFTSSEGNMVLVSQ